MSKEKENAPDTYEFHKRAMDRMEREIPQLEEEYWQPNANDIVIRQNVWSQYSSVDDTIVPAGW